MSYSSPGSPCCHTACIQNGYLCTLSIMLWQYMHIPWRFNVQCSSSLMRCWFSVKVISEAETWLKPNMNMRWKFWILVLILWYLHLGTLNIIELAASGTKLANMLFLDTSEFILLPSSWIVTSIMACSPSPDTTSIVLHSLLSLYGLDLPPPHLSLSVTLAEVNVGLINP